MCISANHRKSIVFWLQWFCSHVHSFKKKKKVVGSQIVGILLKLSDGKNTETLSDTVGPHWKHPVASHLQTLNTSQTAVSR